MKLFKQIVVFLFIVFSSSAFAKVDIIKYKTYSDKGEYLGYTTIIYDTKGMIVDYAGTRYTQVTENNQTTIITGSIKTFIATGERYWHTLGVGVMKSSVITTSEGKRGMLYQTLVGTNNNLRHYEEKVYISGHLVSETETFVDSENKIMASTIKNDETVTRMIRQ